MVADDWYVIAAVALGLGFVIFMLCDSHRLRKKQSEPLPRERIEKEGFIPGASAVEPGILLIAMSSAFVGYMAWVTPTQPPFRGGYAWLSSFLYQAFGPRGLPGLLWLFAAILIAAVLARRLRKVIRDQMSGRGDR
jgi:hypothetical protein